MKEKKKEGPLPKMEPFTRLSALAVPLDLPNIDTDQIIPARFLWRSRASGYGELLFNDLRSPEFVLDAPAYAGARILVTERNFGCGSSREQAVWALHDAGFRAVIAPSFGDIFYNNCCKQGLLPVILPEAEVTALRTAILEAPGEPTMVDLEQLTVSAPGGWHSTFEISAFRRKQLLEGLDEIAYTLGLTAEITAFEARYEQTLPWLAAT